MSQAPRVTRTGVRVFDPRGSASERARCLTARGQIECQSNFCHACLGTSGLHASKRHTNGRAIAVEAPLTFDSGCSNQTLR